MIFKTVRIQKYKSITDSGIMKLADQVTCLVGKNESGKTAVLEAVYRLNPLPIAHPQEFNGLRDYPRRTYNRDRASVPSTTPIDAIFQLEPVDVQVVETKFGKDVLKSTQSPFKRIMKTSAPGLLTTMIASWYVIFSLKPGWIQILRMGFRAYRI
jgi:hypothetical protein